MTIKLEASCGFWAEVTRVASPQRDLGVFLRLEGLALSGGGDMFLDTWLVDAGCATPAPYSRTLGGSNQICGFSDYILPAKAFD